MFGKNPFNEYRATQQQVQEKKVIDAESIDGSTVTDVDASIQEQKFVIPEEIPANERTAFHGAAAAAAKAGKKSFSFAGKTHPVTMKKDTAKAIADQKLNTEGMYKDMDTEKGEPSPRSDAKVKADMKKRRKTEKSDVDMNPKLDKGTKDNSMEQKESVIGETYEVGEVGKTSAGSNQNPAGHSKAATSHTKAAVKHLDQYKATGDSAHKKAADLHKKAADHHAGTSKVHKSTTVDGGVMRDRTRLANKMTAAANAATKTTNESLSIRDKLLAVLSENDREKHYKGAAKPETMDDKLKGKGAKDMGKDHKAKTEKESDFDEKGHDDASKAGKVTKPAAGRSSGDAVRSGDQKIKGTVAAYQKMKGN